MINESIESLGYYGIKVDQMSEISIKLELDRLNVKSFCGYHWRAIKVLLSTK